ncbi:hypothetical protein [Janibacter melonis]|uniref:hypothetical protein n=1 Tax=Janibacter melonis TaxID=262209 RepID=UPI00174DCE7F|nr:hypothetical protein [Janibacter melonis]
MLGFAVVDWQEESGSAAVWLVSPTQGKGAGNTNAVVLDMRNEDDWMRRLGNLTGDRVVVLTDGSQAPGLDRPITSGRDLVQRLSAEVRSARPLAWFTSRRLTRPSGELTPPSEQSPALRALALANDLVQAWSCWLRIEEENVRRTVPGPAGPAPDMSVIAYGMPGFRMVPDPLEHILSGIDA